MSTNEKAKKTGADGDQRINLPPPVENDLQLLHRLEQAIGKKLEQRDFGKIFELGKRGYALAGPSGHEQMVGLNLDEIKLGPAAALIPSLYYLQRLSLNGCQLRDISFIQRLSHLTELNLINNKITDITCFQGMIQMIHLNLSYNQLTDVSSLQGKDHLTHLYLFNNNITDISFLQGMGQLMQLDLGGNQLTDITFIRELCQLTALYLYNNQIIDISSLQGLNNLLTLYLGNNQITDISYLQELSSLTELEIRHNKIFDISYLQRLSNIKKLDLRKNKITQLPEFFLQWSLEINVDDEYGFGQKIYLYGNPLEKPPLEIIKQGNAAIKAYFDSLKADTLPLNEVKILLVGDGGSGKTSLAKRLLGREFDRHESQTHGINIDDHTFQVGNQKIIAHLWDFGGQEIMHASHQFFLSKRSLYILVLDGRKDEKTEYWLKHIESFGKDSPVLVVLNKIDENPGFEVNRKFLMEKYPHIKGFFRLSCLSREGVEPFCRAMEDELSRIDMLKTTWAVSWFNVKTHLEKMSEPFISYHQYLDLCRSEKIAEKIGQETLVDFLHDLGTVLYFKDLELEDMEHKPRPTPMS